MSWSEAASAAAATTQARACGFGDGADRLQAAERASIAGACIYDPEFDLNVAEEELSRDYTDHNIGGEAGQG